MTLQGWTPKIKRNLSIKYYGKLNVYAIKPETCPECKKDALKYIRYIVESDLNQENTLSFDGYDWPQLSLYECAACGFYFLEESRISSVEPEYIPKVKRTLYVEGHGTLDVYAQKPPKCPKCKKRGLKYIQRAAEKLSDGRWDKLFKRWEYKWMELSLFECVACGYYFLEEDRPTLYESEDRHDYQLKVTIPVTTVKTNNITYSGSGAFRNVDPMRAFVAICIAIIGGAIAMFLFIMAFR